MDATVGGALPHSSRMFKRVILFTVILSPNHPRPNTSTSWRSLVVFCCMSPDSSNSTIHIHCVRYKIFSNKKNKKHSYLQYFPCWWPKLTPNSYVCLNIYLNLVDLTTRSAMLSQWKKSAIAISSWASLLLKISLDMAWSNPVWIVICPQFKEGYNSGGLWEVTNAWARELCESLTNWTESLSSHFFPTFREFFLSKRSC